MRAFEHRRNRHGNHHSDVFDAKVKSHAVRHSVHRKTEQMYSHHPVQKPSHLELKHGEKIRWNVESIAFTPCPATKLSDADLQDAKAAFFALDIDHSGTIDKDELATILRSLGSIPSAEELDAIMAEAEADAGGNNDGLMSMREFLVWYAKSLHITRNSSQSEVLEAFIGFGGTMEEGIDKPTLRNALSEMYGVSFENIDSYDALFGSGKLSFDDFKEMFNTMK